MSSQNTLYLQNTLFSEDVSIYIVSDLHMGDGSATDNFILVRPRFEKFLEMVKADECAILILDGDILEMWQAELGDILETNWELISQLLKIQTYYVIGNHDIGMDGFVTLPINTNGMANIRFVNEIRILRNGKNIRIIHGHQFDPYNVSDKATFVGKIISLITAILEHKYPQSGIENRMRKVIEPILRSIVSFTDNLWKTLFGKPGKDLSGLHIILDIYHQQYPDEILITGHTHQPGWWCDYYVNAGSWQETDVSHYVKIDKNGGITLHEFPGNAIITKQVDLYGYMSVEKVKDIYNNRGPLF